MPTIGEFRVRGALGAEEGGVTVGEDATVGGHQPVAPPSGVDAMPTMGEFRCVAPWEPKKAASPWVKMPPSAATSQ